MPFRRRVLLAAAAAADGDGIVMLTNGILSGREETTHEVDVAMTAMVACTRVYVVVESNTPEKSRIHRDRVLPAKNILLSSLSRQRIGASTTEQEIYFLLFPLGR